MKIFENKVAVITGAASGIGYGIANQCAEEGMKIVLGDIHEPALENAEKELKGAGATVLSVRCDVSKISEIEHLAEKAVSTFGQVDLLVNNAGVAAGSTIWKSTTADWEWVLNTNLFGVVYGIKTFVPIMLAQKTEGHILNVAAVAGLTSYHPCAPYHISKHAVVALSEQLYFSLGFQHKLKTSVLCPGFVKTGIMSSERNRPAEMQNLVDIQGLSPKMIRTFEQVRLSIEAGISPGDLARIVFDGLREDRFYILTHPEFNPVIHKRCEALMKGENPDIAKATELMDIASDKPA